MQPKLKVTKVGCCYKHTGPGRRKASKSRKASFTRKYYKTMLDKLTD